MLIALADCFSFLPFFDAWDKILRTLKKKSKNASLPGKLLGSADLLGIGTLLIYDWFKNLFIEVSLNIASHFRHFSYHFPSNAPWFKATIAIRAWQLDTGHFTLSSGQSGTAREPLKPFTVPTATVGRSIPLSKGLSKLQMLHADYRRKFSKPLFMRRQPRFLSLLFGTWATPGTFGTLYW